jgi:putative transposase
MKKQLPSRKSTRLPTYDYSQAGAYFVTISAYNRQCIFGEILNSEMGLSSVGQVVEECWKEVPEHYCHVEIDEHVVMPNHFHGILMIHDVRKPVTLGNIVGSFKSSVTRLVKRLDRENIGPQKTVWQRGYFEHVIRNDDDLAKIREYIAGNSLEWDKDEENPHFHP